ncbi:MAG: 2-isopropylmalate synthase [Myxococcales bacterium]|nr:2-isopropylmalate synthase [Myxococcales bacterium]
MERARELIFDWNEPADGAAPSPRPVALHDETLRDGLQAPSVRDPSLEDKRRIVDLLDAIGVESAGVGLPAAGAGQFDDALGLVAHVAETGLSIAPACAARTLEEDIRPIAEISQRVGVAVEVMAFIGCSPIRQLTEGWSASAVVARAVRAVRFAVREGLPVTFVTEDTTRSRPDALAQLFDAAVGEGASRLCLCDTVGHATPEGAARLVRFVRERVGAEIGLDWHAHNDRGLAMATSLAAVANGVDRVHGCVVGIGERVGNAALEALAVNLALLGVPPGRDLSAIAALCEAVSEATGHPVPRNHPVVGADAFRTSAGVHAAAILKATRKGDAELAERVYSGVPAAMVGRTQEVGIGPLSGLSNVWLWLDAHGRPPDRALAERVLERAKQMRRGLSDAEVAELAGRLEAS